MAAKRKPAGGKKAQLLSAFVGARLQEAPRPGRQVSQKQEVSKSAPQAGHLLPAPGADQGAEAAGRHRGAGSVRGGAGGGGSVLGQDVRGISRRAETVQVTPAWSEPEIEQRASEIAAALRRVATASRNEEELRIGAVQVLRDFAQELGLELEARHEYALGRGRADSVYGRVLIEFEAPGSFSDRNSTPANRRSIAQVQGYAETMSRQDGQTLSRILGVAIDGQRMIFLRHRRGAWEVSPPRDVDAASVADLLFCLKSLQGKALLPDNLVEDFGSAAESARRCVGALYKALEGAKNPKVEALFAQWGLLFSEVCGYELGSPKLDVKTLTESYGVRTRRPDATRFFFCVHTYYATLIKLLAAEIVTFYSAAYLPSYLGGLEALPSDRLRQELATLEEGGIFRQLGVRNLLEGDFFAWYLEVWNEELAEALTGIVRALRSYDPATVRIDPDETRDLLKKLYQRLLPKKLRHDLGEYYTPDWLAELVLEEIGYDGELSKRILDPSCGSGTFLVLEIKRAREWAKEKFLGDADALERILSVIAGFDLNPLAVITARTNYLIALGDLLRHRRGEIEIPVYLCDAILTPAEPRQMTFGGRRFPLETAVGTFEVPLSLATRERISALAGLLEQAVRGHYRREEFLARAQGELGLESAEFAEAEEGLAALYGRFCQVDAEGRNGIWARIIKNFFAPVFAGRFDYVAGNPPWINWESLPDQYRKSTQRLWENYGLFSLKGWRARMGGGKKDLSALFLYVAADKYLNEHGRLGFVITQTLFKSAGAGEGFRHFRLAGTPGLPRLQVQRVHDLVEVKPFEGAANRTAVVTLKKGTPTRYPVPYIVWQRLPGKSLAESMTLAEARAGARLLEHEASPITAKAGAPWMTGSTGALEAVQKTVGPSPYRAHEGLNVGGTSGVYWLRVLEKLPGGLVLVESLPEEGKNPALKAKGAVKAAVEEALVFPLLRGRDITPWRAQPEAAILIPHDPDTGEVYPEATLRVRFPKAYAFLNRFRDELLARKAVQYKGVLREKRKPFYWICNVVVEKQAPSFATWKVLWREVSAGLEIAVAGPAPILNGPERPAVPAHTLVGIQSRNREEAHYLCGLLASAPSRLVVESYVHLHASPHILDHVKVPRFDPKSTLHRYLVELSRSAHAAAAHDDLKLVTEIEAKVDRAAAELWGITAKELKTIQEALRTRKGPARRRAVPGGSGSNAG